MDEKGIGDNSPKDGTMSMSSVQETQPEPPPVVYTEIGGDDVLLGRGKRSYNHGGNVRFRELVLDRALAYKQNENKAYRRAIAQDIIKVVHRNGGKFVRPVEPPRGSGEHPSQWRSVPASVVLTKVKQALRDMSSGIFTDQKPKKLASTVVGQRALAPNLLSSIPNAGSPFLPNSFASTVLPSHPPQLSALGLFHPQLPPQPMAYDSEYSLLMQLASLQQRQQADRMLQMMSQQRSLHAPIPSPISALTLQQQALLHRLNTTMPNQQLSSRLTAQQQELIRGLNPLPNLQGLPSLDRGLQGATHPSHLGDTRMVHAQQLADMLPPSLNPFPHQLGTLLTSGQNNNGFGANTNQTEQNVSLESYIPSGAAHPPQGTEADVDGNLSRDMTSIPMTAGTIQNLLGTVDGPDFARLPLADGGVEPSANNGLDTDEMFGDDNASNESRDDDTFDDTGGA